MSIPDYPENRGEQYLNRIATGEGEIPAYPENRTEQYLDAIARNGGGGGSSGGVLVVVQDDTGTLDKTWQEIHDAGVSVCLYESSGEVFVSYVSRVRVNGSSYEVVYTDITDAGVIYPLLCVADNADGYPVVQD